MRIPGATLVTFSFLLTLAGACGGDDGGDADARVNVDADPADATPADAPVVDAATADADPPDADPPDADPPDAVPADAEPECLVPTTHATIQACIDDIACSTLRVLPGTYTENLTISTGKTIIGIGTVTIDGGGADRVITASNGNTVLRNLTITNGSASQGGGIHTTANLLLEDSRVHSNTALSSGAQGGGIYAEDCDVTLDNSTVDLNLATSPNLSSFGAEGAGIYASGGSLTITNGSVVEENTAGSADVTGMAFCGGAGISTDGTAIVLSGASFVRANHISLDASAATSTSGKGGGILAETGSSVTISEGSAIANNTILAAAGAGTSQAEGGGLYLSASTLMIDRGAIVDNTATARVAIAGTMANVRGGGVFIEKSLTANLVDGSFSGNQAIAEAVAGATGYARGAGLYGMIVNATARAYIGRCTISANSAQAYTTSEGGAMALHAGANSSIWMALIDSTVGGNSATSAVGNSAGGALHTSRDTTASNHLDLSSVTLFNNHVSSTSAAAIGGGLYANGVAADPAPAYTARNTIIYGNTASSSGNDCSLANNAQVTSAGYNLIGDASTCALVGDSTGNQTSVDPLLGNLGDNGGPTSTYALGTGSPAINAGNPTACTDYDGVTLSTDQRGEIRDAEGRCDIGSYEVIP